MYLWVARHLVSHGYVVALFTVPDPDLETPDLDQNISGIVHTIDYLYYETNDPSSPLWGKVK
jgi:hypothetical protein